MAHVGRRRGSRDARGDVVAAAPEAAAGFREYLEDRVWSVVGAHQPPGERERRRALVASQLIGLGWARYVLRLEPLASAPVEDVARWVGPTLDRYLEGPLEPAAEAEVDADRSSEH